MGDRGWPDPAKASPGAGGHNNNEVHGVMAPLLSQSFDEKQPLIWVETTVMEYNVR